MYTLGFAQLLDGDALGALESFDQQPMGGDASWHAARAMAFFSLGSDKEFAASKLSAEQDATEQNALYRAFMFAWIDDADSAFTLLKQAHEADDIRVANRVDDPIFDSLRDDPRWDEFVGEVWFTDDELAEVTLNIP